MRHFYLLLTLTLLHWGSYAQSTVSIEGTITDAKDKTPLIGVNIFVVELNRGTTTNIEGAYQINVPQGKELTLRISYVGYRDTTLKIASNQKTILNLRMEVKDKLLETVEVRSTLDNKNVESIEMSTVQLNINAIKKIPAFLGEVDLVRSVQLLPGVTTAGEGASGFNVRGGSIDQNLVLMDDAPIFNSSHLFGFFSVFNPDAVRDVKLAKGGIPAEYGGRLSSILDVRLRDRNNEKFSGSGGIGAVFSRLALEAPIEKGKGGIIVAGRRSYIDVLAAPFLADDLSGSQFYFYDFTVRADYRINNKNKLAVSSYIGRDVFGASDFFGFDWGNQTLSLKWLNQTNPRLFSTTTAFYSKYDYQISFGNDDEGFKWNSNIINYGLKQDFDYTILPNLKLNTGLQSIFMTLVPGFTESNFEGSPPLIQSLPDKFALENAIYADLSHNISPKLKLRYGMRVSNFNYLGTGTAFIYGQAEPNTRRPLIDRVSYSSGQLIEDFYNWEPRFSANYILSQQTSIKLSYNRMAQYIHLISNTTASVPLDVWTPSTNNIPAQLADQVALGWFQNFKNNAYETSVEVYYKDLKNQIDYIDGAELVLNELLEGELIIGEGRAYGAEFYVKKNSGKLTGWVSYTLARSERLVNGLNNNEWFPIRFDRTHNLNVVAAYELSEKWSVSGNFVFYTGTPATFPTNKYNFQGLPIPHNADNARNNYRIPPYHRLDLSATRQGKKRKWGNGEWVFSIYNLYSRRNPFTIFFEPVPGNNLQTQAVQFAVLGSIVPSVSYNFYF